MSLSTIGVNMPNNFVYTKKKEARVVAALQKTFSVLLGDSDEYTSYIQRVLAFSVMISPVDQFADEKKLSNEQLESVGFQLSIVMQDEDRSQIERLTGLMPNSMFFGGEDEIGMYSLYSHPDANELITQNIADNGTVVWLINGLIGELDGSEKTPSQMELHSKRDRVAIDSLWWHLTLLVEARGERLTIEEVIHYLSIDGFVDAAVRFKSKSMKRLIDSIGGTLPESLGDRIAPSERVVKRFNAVMGALRLLPDIQFGLFQGFSRAASGIAVGNELMKASAHRIKDHFERDYKGKKFSYNKCLQALSVGLFGCPFEESKVVHLPMVSAEQAKLILDVVLKQGVRLSCYHDLMGLTFTEVSPEEADKARLNDRLLTYAMISFRHSENSMSPMPMGRSFTLSHALCQSLSYRYYKQKMVLSFANILKAHTVDEVIRMVDVYDIPKEGNSQLIRFMDTLPMYWRSDGTIDKEKSVVGLEQLQMYLMAGQKYLCFLSEFSSTLR